MKTKIEIFAENSITKLENEVNVWLAKFDNLVIEDIKFATNVDTENNLMFSAMIIYHT